MHVVRPISCAEDCKSLNVNSFAAQVDYSRPLGSECSCRLPVDHRCDKRLQRLQKKILCRRVYYFVNVYLNKNHTSETKQNYDGKPETSSTFTVIFVWLTSWRKFLTARPLFRGLNNESSSVTVTATKIISGQDNST